MNKQPDGILSEMLQVMRQSSSLYQPSSFWQDLNRVHLEYLSTSGLANFKRTINNKYFNWGVLGIIAHQLSPILQEFKRGHFDTLLDSEFKNYSTNFGRGVKKFNQLAALIYKVYLVSLFEYVSQNDELRLFNRIKEPLYGNPFIVRYKNKIISQDLCNSIYDFYSITQNSELPKEARIAELGAGYGRLSYVFLKALPNSRFCIIDIPPALFLSQTYLTKVFGKTKIFKFRNFKSFRDVKEEFEEARLCFLMPHQMELLPKKYFDLFVNISSLHEMTRRQIKNYINQIDRLCKGFFYTKQWRKSRTPDNQFIEEDEYPIPKHWKLIIKRSPHPIQRMFFDTLYKIKFPRRK